MKELVRMDSLQKYISDGKKASEVSGFLGSSDLTPIQREWLTKKLEKSDCFEKMRLQYFVGKALGGKNGEKYILKQQKGEIPPGDIIFIMVSGDGGMDIGMGSAIGTALRGHRLLIFEYDNGGYMNTGYQLSYSTPLGARSSTSHVGKTQYGKTFLQKDMPKIMAATGIPYVATVAESNPADFMKKAAKAAHYAKTSGTAYVKAISACPLNWNDKPATERRVIEAAVNCCYFPLYEIEQGVMKLSYNPEKNGKKIPVTDWLAMMGRTKHLLKEEYSEVTERLQNEVDARFSELIKWAE